MSATIDSVVDCTCNVCKSVRLRIDQIFRVLDIFGWMLDFYVVVHAYRAVLENILTERNLLPPHSQLKNVKVTGDMTFKQYCILVTRHLQLELRPNSKDLEGVEIENCL